MLEVEYPTDYLKKEGINPEVVNPLEEEQQYTQQDHRSFQPKPRVRRQYNPDDTNIAKLFLAIREHKTGNPQVNKISEIKGLLTQIKNINDIDFNDNGNTLLHVAVSKRHKDVVKLLLDKGAKIDIKNNIGISPLDIDMSFGNQIIIGKLQEHSKLGHSNRRVSSVQQQPKSDSTLKKSQAKEVYGTKQNINGGKFSFYDQQHGSQTFEGETEKGNYGYWLQQNDIARIAKDTYEWYGEAGIVIFEVIGSVEQLEIQLERHKNLIVTTEKLLTFIVNLGNFHWVTLVVAYQNQQFSAYYVDSFATGIQDNIKDILEKKIKGINIKTFGVQQQSDGYNCGIFALENAKIISGALHGSQSESIEEKLSNYKPTKEELENTRREFAEKSKKINDASTNLERSEINGRLEEFVEVFVKRFEEKLKEYEEEGYVGGTPKTGKMGKGIATSLGAVSGAIGGLASGVTGAAGGGSTIGGKASSFFWNFFGGKSHRKKAKNVTKVFRHMEKDELRSILVEAGSDIFRSFESQFIKVTDADRSWVRGMEKLAVDAMDRAINYISCCKHEDSSMKRKREDYLQLITQGVILGESKKGISASVVHFIKADKLNKLSYIPERIKSFISKPGHTVKNEAEEWKTEDLYKGVGIVEINEKGYCVKYYRKRYGDNAEKYGYRLPFEGDKTSDYRVHEERPSEEYKYTLEPEELKQKLKVILNRIKEKTPVPNLTLEELTKSITHSLLVYKVELNPPILEKLDLPTDDKTQTDQKVTKLHNAVSAGNEKDVETLLERKAEVNAETVDFSITPLHLAAQGGYERIVQDLLNTRDIEVNARTKQGATALHYVAYNGYEKIVKDLLGKGAKVNVKTISDGFTPLHYAAQNGNKKVVEILLKKEDINVNEINDQGATALHYAAKYGHKEIVNTLLKAKKIDVNLKTTDEDATPLYFAVQENHKEVVDALLEVSGIEVNDENKYGDTPLHRAVNNQHVDIVRALLSRNANVNAANNGKSVPLHFAAQNGFIAIVKGLLGAHGIDVNAINDQGATPLHYAVENDHKEVVEALLDKGANVETTDQQGLTPLHMAARSNLREVVEVLLDKDADINLKSTQGFAPLHIAAALNNREIVKVLLDRDADFNVQSTSGNTPLHLAVQSGHIEVVKALLNKGADFNAKATDQGLTPLHYAAEKGNKEVVEVLFLKGADIDAKTTDKSLTPLHIAVQNGHKEIVEVLLLKGADIDAKTTDKSLTPLHMAAALDKKEVVNVLLDRGADVNAEAIQGFTPLHLAVQNGHKEVVKALLDKGANVDTETAWGTTLLDYAARKNYWEIVIVLLGYGANFTNLIGITKKEALDDYLKDKKIDEDVIKTLVWQHNVNTEDSRGWTPLHKAAKNGNIDIVNAFLRQENVNINAKTIGKVTPLHIAVAHGHLNVVNALLEKQADPNIQDNNGKTPLDLAQEKLFQDPENDAYKTITGLLLSITDESKSQHIEEQTLALEQCLPSTSPGRKKRNVENECLFTWEDVDEFKVEKDENRDFSKINIDSQKFINYVKDLPEEKRTQLIQLADEVQVTGGLHGLVNKLTSNQKVMDHLNRAGKISGMTMHGMMAKNVLADFLNGNYQGVAVNVGFIAGGQGFAKVAEAASLKGLELASKGKFLLSRSLKAASPFLARGTSAFVVYDLINQVKEYKNGTEEALVGIVGDGIYLGVDAAEIGIEVAEAFELLEGVSSVTGPIGATIGAVVFVGTDIYMAVKRVDKIDEIIHLTGNEKFVEGLRAFIGMEPRQYIEELMEEKQVNNQLVNQGLEYLQQHSDIKRYIFPTGKSVVDSCSLIPYDATKCIRTLGLNGGRCLERQTVTKYYRKCTNKFEVDLNNEVLLDSKRTDIKWSRARPDNPNGGELFCLPQGDYEHAPSYGSYFCESAIGVTDLNRNKIGNYTLINLG